MGTTAQKFAYSFEAKDMIKEGINNLGGDLTDENELKEYAQELNDIYNNIPKTTDTGTNLSLNTIKGKMNIIPKGDTQQDTTNGYQLIDLKDGTYTKYGLTAVVSNGKVTINGNTDVVAIIEIDLNNTLTLTNGQNYTLYGFNTTTNSEVAFRPIGDYGNFQIDFSTTNNKATRTFGNTTTTLNKIGIRVGGGTSVSNLVCSPMLISGSDTSKSYEHYTNGASPNPTYPQNIEVVTGTQEVKVENINKLPYASESTNTINDMVFTSNGKGTYTLNGTASATSYYDYSISEYTIKSTDYLYLKNTETNSNISVALLNGNTQIMYTGPSQTNRVVSLSSYAGSTINTLRIRTTAQTLSNFTLKPMIAEITTLTDFVEHQEQTQTISLGDIELCKIGNYQDYLYKTSGKWYKKEYIGKYLMTGNENISTRASGVGRLFELTGLDINATTITDQSTNKGFSNRFIYNVQLTNNYNIRVIGGTISIHIEDYTEVSTFKTWLASINANLYYVLATPNDIEITDTNLITQLNNLEKAKSYNGVTNISSSGNLSAILSVSALKGES